MTDVIATLPTPAVGPTPLVNTRFDIFIEDCTRIADDDEPLETTAVAFTIERTVIQTGVDVAVKLGCGSSKHWSQSGPNITCALSVKLATT